MFTFNLPAVPTGATNVRYEMRIVNGAGIDAIFKPCKQKNIFEYLKCQAKNLVKAVTIVRTRVVAGTVKLNGTVLLKQSNFNIKTDDVILAVQPKASGNKLEVEVEGIPGSYITIHVVRIHQPGQGVNTPPIADFTYSPETLIAPITVSFSGLASYDNDAGDSIASYAWNFGDGVAASGTMVVHSYQNPGQYNVILTVTDSRGAQGTKTIALNVIGDTTAPVVTLTSPQEGAVYESRTFNLIGLANEPLSSLSASLNGGTPFSVPLSSVATGFSVIITPPTLGAQSLTLVATDLADNTSTYTLNFTVDINTPPTAQFIASRTEGAAPLIVTFDASSSSDAEGALTYQWNFGDGQSGQGVQVTHEFTNVGEYHVTLRVTDAGGLYAEQSITIKAMGIVLPPDPSDVAPALSQTEASSVYDSTRFLYTGANPVQTGVAPNAIVAPRVSILRGRVVTDDGQPLSGVKISILNEPSLGQTLSRADGWFDMAVNGGSTLVVKYERDGYLSSARPISTDFNLYYQMPEVVLIQPDAKATVIAMNSPAMQVAQGSPMTDNSGTRTATVLIPPQTTAEFVLPNGARQPASQLTLRATEYTVGPNGPKKMPAPLPETSAYTYAVEMTADEALALGAKHIEFSQPVPVYVDNFLGFTVGAVTPIGTYEPDRGVWLPQKDGRVVKIQSISNGQAQLIVNTNNQIATSAELTSLGITSEELTRLASLYQPGQTFWRAVTSSFTCIDFNYLLSRRVRPPEPPLPRKRIIEPTFGQCKIPNASTISLESQTLGESLPLVGTPFSLEYMSDRVPGRVSEDTLTVQVSGATVPDNVVRIELDIFTLGDHFHRQYMPTANITETYIWPKSDIWGRPYNSAVKARVRLSYIYAVPYLESLFSSGNSFAGMAANGVTLSSVPGRDELSYETEFTTTIGSNQTTALQGFGYWTLNAHHAYDPVSARIYKGDGSVQISDMAQTPPVLQTIAGTGGAGYSGDGGPAVAAAVSSPILSISKDGSLYLGDAGNHRIRKITPEGVITTIAGNGTAGFSGDGGPAISAQLNAPGMVSEGIDGSLYIADTNNHRIRRISPSGIITTVIGTGTAGFSEDDGLALNAAIRSPNGVIAAADGSLYIGDTGNHRIRRIGTDGIIKTVAGTGQAGYSGDGDFGYLARLNQPYLSDIDRDGNLYVADRGNNRIRRIAADGTITLFAGTGSAAYSGDSGRAVQAAFRNPSCAKVGFDNTIYICDSGNHVIRAVGSDGIIQTVAGRFGSGYNGDNNLAVQSLLNTPISLAVNQKNDVFFSDSLNYRIRKIAAPFSLGLGIDMVSIPSKDGAEIYLFTKNGRHLETKNSVTGATKWLFSYDAAGFLVAVVDGDGNTTSITRDVSGRPTSIMSPYGDVTRLAVDTRGLLLSLTNPNNETYRMTYHAGALLATFENPRGAVSSFAYNDLGELIRDTNANQKSITLTREPSYQGGYLIKMRSPMGQESKATVYSTYYNEFSDFATSYNKYSSTSLSPRNSMLTQITRDFLITEYDTHDQRLGPSARYINQKSVTPLNVILLSSLPTLNQQTTVQKNITQRTGIFDYDQLDTITVNNKSSTIRYTSGDRTYVTTSPGGRQTASVVDEQLRPLSVQIPGLSAISYLYDSRGRLSQVSTGSRQTTLSYNDKGYVESITDPIGRQTGYQYDNAGRVTQKILPDSRVVNFSYDGAGNLTGVQPPGRPSHGFIYDLLNQVSQYLPPSLVDGPTHTVFEYNDDRQPTRILRPNGDYLNFERDQYGRVQILRTKEGTVFRSFSHGDKVMTLGTGDGLGVAFEFHGPMIATERVNGMLTGFVRFNYDNDFKITAITVDDTDINPPVPRNPPSAVNYTYNDDYLPTAVGNMTMAYSSQNTLLQGTTLGSVSDTFGYNGHGEMTNYTATYGGAGLYSASLVRDDLGRITSKTESTSGITATYSYGYDLQGRLTSVTRNGVTSASYGYDDNGNRSGGVYDNHDRLLSYGGNTYAYNLNGDLDSKTHTGDKTTYKYDILSNLREVTLSDGRVITYVIDGRNRRVAKRINGALQTHWVYQSQLQIAAEIDAAGFLQTHYIYGTKPNIPAYFIRGGATYRIISDHLGSPRVVVNVSTGEVMQRMDFDEFGRVLTDTNPGFQPFGFAGGLYDRDTGLVRFGARDYDPETGRWTSKDPILFGGGDTNLFGYVANDPVNWIDPSGLRQDDGGHGDFGRAAGAFTGAYIQMRWENRIGNDKYWHCMANCAATQYGDGGELTAILISDWREQNDRTRKGDSEFQCQADQQANQRGRDIGRSGGNCSASCGSSFPY